MYGGQKERKRRSTVCEYKWSQAIDSEKLYSNKNEKKKEKKRKKLSDFFPSLLGKSATYHPSCCSDSQLEI